MIIVIDLQSNHFIESRKSDLVNKSISLVKGVFRNCGSHKIIIVLNEQLPESLETIRAEFEGLLSKENIKVWHSMGSLGFNVNENEWRRKVVELSREAFIASLDPDLVIMSSLFEGLNDNVVFDIHNAGKRIPVVLILWDHIPLVSGNIFPNKPFIEELYKCKLESLRSADLLLTISESSRQDSIKNLGISPLKIVGISGAVDSKFQPIKINRKTKATLFNRYGINRPFIMYSGGIDHRKNVGALIRAYAKLSKVLLEENQLVIVCNDQPESQSELEILAFQNGLNHGEVIFTGYLSDEDIIQFYNLCKVFVFPSFYEGFCQPVLEAMSCGRAVICSNTSDLPELVGREDALFDPYNDQSIYEKLIQVLTNDTFRLSLEENGLTQAKLFSWDKSAKRLISAIESLDISNGKGVESVPSYADLPRLAYLSPLPPERSGISDYSAELLPELAKYYQIDVIVDQSTISDPWINSHCTIRDYKWFKINANTYDRVLYHFGNSQYHKYMFSYLEAIPGVVVLHDFYLSHIIACLEELKTYSISFEHSLYLSHGYLPFKKTGNKKSKTEIIWEYPCNLCVLQNALGVIVHSQYSSNLARRWYGKDAANNWSVIPMLRIPALLIDPIEARNKLQLSASDFIVCSFGMLGPNKLNERLLQSWLDSSLLKDENCKLIFVGENPEGQHCDEINKIINESGLSHRIQITGWADSETYRNYLSAADIGVQLRCLSRGETSAAILDCLNYGLATIANLNGSISEFPENIICKISDNFENSELTKALETLWRDDKKRKKIAQCAREYIQTYHNPKECAEQYVQSIESFYQHSAKTKTGLIRAIGQLDVKPAIDSDIFLVASTLAQNFPPRPQLKQLFADLTEFFQTNNRNDFQQILPSIILELFENQTNGYRVEPVYCYNNQFYYARQYTMSLLDNTDILLDDEPIEYFSGDIFLVFDWNGLILKDSLFQFELMNNVGVDIYFMVNDILPLRLRQYFTKNYQIEFENYLSKITEFSKGLICTSKTTADELIHWFEVYNCDKRKSINVNLFQLAAIKSTRKLNYVPKAEDIKLIHKIKMSPFFLMVGTIEPHKGYLQTLSAFNELWSQGIRVNLIVIGNVGGINIKKNNEKKSKIISIIRKHHELNKRLFWINEINDELLDEIYLASSCLIAPAEGEGIGSSLYKASLLKIPILARDIPIFREIAGESATYFDGVEVGDLSSAIKKWFDLKANERLPSLEDIPNLKLEKVSKQLMKIFEHNNIYYEIKPNTIKRIFVDISILTLSDNKTGIQRVDRSITLELLKNPPPGFLVIPISIQQDHQNSGKWYIVECYLNNKIGGNYNAEVHSPLEPQKGDIFLGLDLSGSLIINSEKESKLFSNWRDKGVEIVFVIYDLLPLCMPDKFPPDVFYWFKEWYRTVLQVSDKLLCISKSIAIEVLENTNDLMGIELCEIEVDYFHLGADIQNSIPTKGLPDDYMETISKIKTTLSFLVVSSIDSRKGHLQTLSAFEELWELGFNVNLIIVGHEVWKGLPENQRRTVPEIISKLRNHKELNKHLLWLEGISDEFLDMVYSASTCLLIPSEGEGFGLPLIEAAQHKISIIARDIPVFREIAGEFAYYFNGLTASDLSLAIKDWIQLFNEDNTPKSENIPFLTWAQSTDRLKDIIFKKNIQPDFSKIHLI